MIATLHYFCSGLKKKQSYARINTTAGGPRASRDDEQFPKARGLLGFVPRHSAL